MSIATVSFPPNTRDAVSESHDFGFESPCTTVLDAPYDADSPDAEFSDETGPLDRLTPFDNSDLLERSESTPDMTPAADAVSAAEEHDTTDRKSDVIATLVAANVELGMRLMEVYDELEQLWAEVDALRGEVSGSPTTEANRSSDAKVTECANPDLPPTTVETIDVAAPIVPTEAQFEPAVDEDPAQDVDVAHDVDAAESDTDEDGARRLPPKLDQHWDVTLDGVKIPPKQRRAAQLLASGAKVIDAARAVGVTRDTVQRWKRESPGFRALLNTYCNELQENGQARLWAATDIAVSVIVDRIEEGDLKAAQHLLKGLGLLTGKPRTPSSERADVLEGIDWY